MSAFGSYYFQDSGIWDGIHSTVRRSQDRVQRAYWMTLHAVGLSFGQRNSLSRSCVSGINRGPRVDVVVGMS